MIGLTFTNRFIFTAATTLEKHSLLVELMTSTGSTTTTTTVSSIKFNYHLKAPVQLMLIQ